MLLLVVNLACTRFESPLGNQPRLTHPVSRGPFASTDSRRQLTLTAKVGTQGGGRTLGSATESVVSLVAAIDDRQLRAGYLSSPCATLDIRTSEASLTKEAETCIEATSVVWSPDGAFAALGRKAEGGSMQWSYGRVILSGALPSVEVVPSSRGPSPDFRQAAEAFQRGTARQRAVAERRIAALREDPRVLDIAWAPTSSPIENLYVCLEPNTPVAALLEHANTRLPKTEQLFRLHVYDGSALPRLATGELDEVQLIDWHAAGRGK